MARMYDPPHPGEVFHQFVLEETTIESAATRLGVSRWKLSRILHARSDISADMAIRIGLLTRTTPESWLSMQTKWSLWQALQKPRPAVKPLRRARGVPSRISTSTRRFIGSD